MPGPWLGTKGDDLEGAAYRLAGLCVRLGDRDGDRRLCEGARRWLDEAVPWIDKHARPAPAGGPAPLPPHPHDWVACEILRREAEALLRSAR
jgi:hypothetical protein